MAEDLDVKLEEMLALVRKNKGSAVGRIVTADRYLKTLERCTGELCPTDRARYQGVTWEAAIKAASSRMVYTSPDAVGFGQKRVSANGSFAAGSPVVAFDGGLKPLAIFDAVLTSSRQDRDKDILEPRGANIDPRCPLLWQHDATSPIGKLLSVLGQDETKAMGQLAIADTALGNDAAYLCEFGALRISHGFMPVEFEPMTEKAGNADTFVGFHVTRYDMMEVSLVSVPSNTDAIVEAFHRMKLSSPMAKSMGKNLDERRRRIFTTGTGLKALKSRIPFDKRKRTPPTGKKASPKPRTKSVEEFEQKLAEAAASIVHSGDYGYAFYKPADGTESYHVWYTMGDGDGAGQVTEDGTPHTTEEEVKSALMAVPGTVDVQIGPQANPPYDEGWREVYPDVKDWTQQNDKPPHTGPQTPPADGAPPAGQTPPSGDGVNAPTPTAPGMGTGHKPAGAKGDKPVTGSFEHIAEVLADSARDYLLSQGVPLAEDEQVRIEATYPDYVVICVGRPNPDDGDELTDHHYYKVGFTQGDDGTPKFTGSAQEVELELTVTGGTPSTAPGAAPPGGSDAVTPPVDGGSTDGSTGGTNDGTNGNGVSSLPNGTAAKPTPKGPKWRPVKKTGKKDMGKLKEAAEHIDEAMKREMPVVCKTLCRRSYDLIHEVMKSPTDDQGVQPDDPAQQVVPDMPPGHSGFSPTALKLWEQITKALKEGAVKNRLALAFLLDQFAAALLRDDVDDEVKKLTGQT